MSRAGFMTTTRLEAMTDGVLAIVITIMVLELDVPERGGLSGLAERAPTLLAYVLSFITVGLFWTNHHHLMQAADRVDGRTLWANLFHLFWLSLVPFVVRWLNESGFAQGPVAAYGVVLGMAALGYQTTERTIIAGNPGSMLARAVGRDVKGALSLAIYAAAVPLSFVSPATAIAAYCAVLLLWLVPDRRIERALANGAQLGEPGA